MPLTFIPKYIHQTFDNPTSPVTKERWIELWTLFSQQGDYNTDTILKMIGSINDLHLTMEEVINIPLDPNYLSLQNNIQNMLSSMNTIRETTVTLDALTGALNTRVSKTEIDVTKINDDTLPSLTADLQDFASTKKDEALAAAELYAAAQRTLAETNAAAYADGKVTAEEQARIEEALTNLTEAKNHANTTAQAAETAAKAYVDEAIITKDEIYGEKFTNIEQSNEEIRDTIEDNKYYYDDYGNKILISSKVNEVTRDVDGFYVRLKKTGNNLLKGTDFKNLDNWLGASIQKPYFEQRGQPDNPSEGIFWYDPSTGDMYQYVEGVWVLVNYTRKQLEESYNAPINFEIIDNQFTKNNSKSGRFGRLNSDGKIIHKLEVVSIEEDYITLAFNIMNNISQGKLKVIYEQYTANIYQNNTYSGSGFNQRNIIILDSSSEDQRYEFRLPLIKAHNIILTQLLATPPEDTTKLWFDGSDLYEYDSDSETWISYTGTRYPIAELDSYRYYLWDSSSYYIANINTMAGDTAAFSIGFEFIKDAGQSSGYVDIYDIKCEYGESTDWLGNSNEMSGTNFSFTERGFVIQKGNDSMVIDEDEISSYYKNIATFGINKGRVFSDKADINEQNLNGNITKVAYIDYGTGPKKTIINYDE